MFVDQFIIFSISFFFFNDTATTEIYTLSLHDALPIYPRFFHSVSGSWRPLIVSVTSEGDRATGDADRKSTRLNSSHRCISYAVFCLKKKKKRPVRDVRKGIQQKRCQQRNHTDLHIDVR